VKEEEDEDEDEDEDENEEKRGTRGKKWEADRKRSEHALAKVCSHTIACSVCSLSSVSLFYVPLLVISL
jgi:hypothetical protein